MYNEQASEMKKGKKEGIKVYQCYTYEKCNESSKRQTK
jgi:hypothetical protein